MFKLGFCQTLEEKKTGKLKNLIKKINGYAIEVQEKLIVKTLYEYSSPFTTIILLFVNYKKLSAFLTYISQYVLH